MAFDSQGRLYVSSRFEGTVYRVGPDGSAEPFARDLGVACGIAFDADDAMFVGDRSGKIFRVDRDARATVVATLPESIAAFHLAIGPDRALYVTGPTLVVARFALPRRTRRRRHRARRPDSAGRRVSPSMRTERSSS